MYRVSLIVCFFQQISTPSSSTGTEYLVFAGAGSFSGEVWGRLHGQTVCWWAWPLLLGQPVRQTVSYSLKVRGALGCFVQESRLVQGVGYVGLRLPRQADGLREAFLEDSSVWMVLGSRD